MLLFYLMIKKAQCHNCGCKSRTLGINRHMVCNKCSEAIDKQLKLVRPFCFHRIRSYEHPITFKAKIVDRVDNHYILELPNISKINVLHHVTEFVKHKNIVKKNACHCVFLSNDTIAGIVSKDMMIIDDNYDDMSINEEDFRYPQLVNVAAKIYITGPAYRAFIFMGIGAFKPCDD